MERLIVLHAVLLVVELAPVFKPLGHPFAKELPDLSHVMGEAMGAKLCENFKQRYRELYFTETGLTMK